MRGAVHLPQRSPEFISANLPSDDVGRSAAKTALAELERAICHDRSHVVFTASPGAEKTRVLRALVERLACRLRVVRLAPAGLRPEETCARVLRGLGHDPGPNDEGRLLGLVQQLASQDSALVLLIRDADALPPEALGYLGRLAAAARPGLRLALTLSIDGRSKGGSIATLIAALGVGAQKIALDLPAERNAAGAVARLVPAAVQRPPPTAASRTRDSRPRLPQDSAARAMRWTQALTVTLGLLLALLAARQTTFRAEPEPSRVAETGAAARSAGPVTEANAEKDAAAPGAPVQPAPTVAKTQPIVEGAVRSIRVSLNARPWARIEIDGRDVGITPLADLAVSPGLHRFRAHLPDGRVVERDLRVDRYRDHISFP